MDHFYIEAITLDISERIAGARIDKIHQPDAETIIMRLWNGRETLRLLLGFAAGRARLHLTEERLANPFTPLRFCQLLRARLNRIGKVEKLPQERSVRLHCRGVEGEEYLLAAEFFGAQANLLLVNSDGIIIDSLKRTSGGREANPGTLYRPPIVSARYFLADSLPELPPESTDPAFFEKWLLGNVVPISPLTARDLAAAVAGGISPVAALETFRRSWLDKEFSPTIATLAGQTILTAFPVRYLPLENRIGFASLSAAADRYFLTTGGPVAGREDLPRVIARALQRLRSRQKKIEVDRQSQEAATANRQMGELLLANLHRIRRGMPEIAVDNYYVESTSPLTIPLDPRLSPQENAEHYFRVYKKKQKGREHAERRLKETEDEIAWLEELAHFLAEAKSADELEEIRRDLIAARLLPSPVVKARKKLPDIRDVLHRGKTPGGFQLWWGKNSRSNEYVSRELTGDDDLWFHAHRMPGCHLVLKRAGRPGLPEEDQRYAASLAAGYSSGKNAGKVDVMVAEGRYVRQPKGAHCGQVSVDHFHTLSVTPRRLEDGAK